MFDLGWSELLLIGIVALIVVGPKDLPVLFRKVGQFVGRARAMAREFSRAMDEAADQTGMKETAQSLRSLADPKQMGLDKIREATDDITSWDPDSHTGQLAEERAEAARKIQESTAKAATERKAAEAAAAKQAAAQSAAAKPKTAKAKAAKPKTAKPKTAKPKTAKPKAAKPKPAKPRAAKPKAATAAPNGPESGGNA